MNDYKRKCLQAMRILLITFCITTGFLLGTQAIQAAAKIGLNRTYVVTTKGGTVQLKLNGTKETVKWSSTDTSVAKVSKSGKVTALKNGYVTIKAAVKKKEYVCEILINTLYVDAKTLYLDKTLLKDSGYDDVDFGLDGTNAKIPIADVKLTIKDKGIVDVQYVKIEQNGTSCIHWVKMKGIKDGKTTVSFTMGKVTKSVEVIVETGTGRLDPVDAIKERNYIGYSESEAGTLKKVAEIIDNNNLNSNTLSTYDKIKAIQDYFIETRESNKASDMEGVIANVVFNGHGLYKFQGREERDYAETFSLLCDCLDIPVKYCIGGVYLPGKINYKPDYVWNEVEIDGKWFYIDIHYNTINKSPVFFLSETLWEDFDLWEEGDNISVFLTNGIKYIDQLSQKEYKEEIYWDVD
jgi:hypothetical protein